MQFNTNWLNEFITLNISASEMCDQLTMAGLEVDEYKQIKSQDRGEDYIIKLDLTPNRGDCFSVRGIARELSIINNIKFNDPLIENIKPSFKPVRKINVISEAPIYVGRSLKELNNTKNSKGIIQERLELNGVRLIDPIVDITNYILFETGQPLHAFDEEKLVGDIAVRFARNGEKIVLLDEHEIALSKDCLIIADQEGPIALAGIMGGLRTCVDSTTTSCFLESAFFKPEFIRGRARRYGIQTDASMRFERGVDFRLQQYAIERASNLIQMNLGGTLGPIQKEIKTTSIPKVKNISINLEEANNFLGTNISKREAKKSLTDIGCKLISDSKNFKLTPPSWRFDLEISADLVEELARLKGFDKISNQSLMPISVHKKANNPLKDIRKYLVYKGFSEVITYSFIDPKKAVLLEEIKKKYVLENPISETMSIMRPSLLTNLVDTFLFNRNRGQEIIRIFEVGSVFNKGLKNQLNQQNVLGGLIGGTLRKMQWNQDCIEIDFFELKGEVENIFKIINQELIFKKQKIVGLHPGKTASIHLKSKPSKRIGYLGHLSPQVSSKLNIKDEVIFFQIETKYFSHDLNINYKDFAKYPVSQRDLSFVVDKETESEELLELMKDCSLKYNIEISIFDVYEGTSIEAGKKSISFALTLSSNKGTLNDAEVDKVIEKIIKSSETKTWQIRK